MKSQKSSAEDHFAGLAKAVRGLPESEVEATQLGLGPQQKRLYTYLRDKGTANTISIRQDCAIGNVSQAAICLNEKLERMGDSVRVSNEQRPLVNRFGNSGTIGWWFLVDLDVGDAA